MSEIPSYSDVLNSITTLEMKERAECMRKRQAFFDNFTQHVKQGIQNETNYINRYHHVTGIPEFLSVRIPNSPCVSEDDLKRAVEKFKQEQTGWPASRIVYQDNELIFHIKP